MAVGGIGKFLHGLLELILLPRSIQVGALVFQGVDNKAADGFGITIWNAVNLNCERKFRNFWGSTRAVWQERAATE